MRTIKDLTVKLTFEVGFGDVEVSDEVYKGLVEIEQEGYDVNNLSDAVARANDWLNYNVKVEDAYEWEYEVEVIDEED
jgi:hypothetical protein